jgi:ribosome biogenesis GTPase
VLERDGAVYRVATEAGVVRAALRGKAKRDTPHVVVGDRVRLDADAGTPDTYGIAGMEERQSLLARRVPGGRGLRPVAANVDQVFVVTATVDPAPILQLIDRLLVVAEANDLPAALILNKTDLDAGEGLAQRMEKAGYAVYRVSARSGAGLEALRTALENRITVVSGPSGAGKSSLLNALEPGLSLRIGALSAKIRRGANTTVSAVMVPLSVGGFLVDTPGFSDVGLWGIAPADLPECFPEIRLRQGQCRYADCRHTGEPGCAMSAAVDRGEILQDRLDSYRVLLGELEDQPEEWE